MTTKYYSIYYVNNKDKSLKLVKNYEYFDNLEKATNTMLRCIENYKIPKYSKKFYTPINMDCDYNIRIYNVEVWKCLNNYNFKIEPISQAFPLVSKPSKELDKYIELCDLENMTIAKLCLEIYGENITMEKIKEIRKIKLDNLVNIINKKISKSKYNKINIDLTSIFYKDNDEHIIYSTNNILADLYKYYTDIGYIFKYINDYYDDVYEYTLFLFNKSYIDDLYNKFDIILKDNNLDCINYYDNDNVMKKNKKKYLLDKYLINITDDNIKHLIRDEYQEGYYYFESFYDFNYTYDFYYDN